MGRFRGQAGLSGFRSRVCISGGMGVVQGRRGKGSPHSFPGDFPEVPHNPSACPSLARIYPVERHLGNVDSLSDSVPGGKGSPYRRDGTGVTKQLSFCYTLCMTVATVFPPVLVTSSFMEVAVPCPLHFPVASQPMSSLLQPATAPCASVPFTILLCCTNLSSSSPGSAFCPHPSAGE